MRRRLARTFPSSFRGSRSESPESILPPGGYGVRARDFVAPRNDEGSEIDHHIVALHRHRQRLRDIRPLHDGRARLDIDRIGLGAKPLWIAVGLPGADIELPAMPGAADDLA